MDSVLGLSVYALTSPFVKHRPDPHQHLSIEELASFYVAEIKRRQPEGPYVMGGYSIGGVVAFEAVRQLLENADEVEKLFLIDTPCPTRMGPLPNVLVGFLDSIDCTSIAEGDTLREKRRDRLISNNHFAMSMQQLKEYKMRNLPGRKIPLTVVISAKEGVDKQNKVPRPDTLPEDQAIVSWLLDDKPDDGPLGWDDVLECVKVVRANGNHFSMMMPPMVDEWGLELAHYLMLGRD